MYNKECERMTRQLNSVTSHKEKLRTKLEFKTTN